MTPINFVYWFQGFFELEQSLLGTDFISLALNAEVAQNQSDAHSGGMFNASGMRC